MVAVQLSWIAGPLATPGSASVTESGFCVKAVGYEGEFEGDRAFNCDGKPSAPVLSLAAPLAGSTPACVLRPGALGMDPKITMNWAVPAEMKGYTVKETEVGIMREGVIQPINRDLLGAVSTAGDPSKYGTTFTAKQLSGGLAGQAWTFGIRFVDPKSGKASAWLTGTAAMGNAGTNPTCSVGVVK
ncbi:hypothetical protein D514_0104170 [Microbacterium sp. UCD-TDU]|nr:hypothetical protein D514_0104170 [Microbacterium sp. UCD-TDU]